MLPVKRQFARDLRKRATVGEKRVWELLRGRRLGGLKFRRQHPIAGFIVDFYCAELRLAVELDGGVHESPERQEYDGKRTAALRRHGVCVIRLRNDDVSESRLRGLILPLAHPSPAMRERGQG